MFLPNSNSFSLVKSKISKPVIQPGVFSIAESETILPLSSVPDSGRKMFLPNSHSFSLIRSVKPIVQSDIEESTTSLLLSSLSDSGRKTFLPNSHSFLLIRSEISKPVIQYDIEESETDLSRLRIEDPDSLSGPSSASLEDSGEEPGKSTIGDKHKRTFLKVAGIAGASLAGSLLLPKKADAFIMGSSPTTGVVGVKDSTNERINPATEETVSSLLKPTDLTFDAGALSVKVTSVSGAGSSSFSDSGDVAKSGLVDADRHLQVDVLTSALPASASTETTLQTISFGGFKFALRLATVGSVDYVGEAAVGTATSASSWRVKKIDSTTGVIIQWAGTGVFDQIWDNYASLTYS